MPAFLSEGRRIGQVHPRDPIAQLDYYLTSGSSDANSTSCSPSLLAHNQRRSNLRPPISARSGLQTITCRRREKAPFRLIEYDRRVSIDDQQSTASESFYATTLDKILGKRRRQIKATAEKTDCSSSSSSVDQLAKHRKEADWKLNSNSASSLFYDGESPVNTSGFSEKTWLAEQSFGAHFVGANQEVEKNLRDPNYAATYGLESDNSHYKGSNRRIGKLRDVRHNVRYAAEQVSGSGDSRQQRQLLANANKKNNNLELNKRNFNCRLKKRNLSRLNRRMLIGGEGNLMGNPYALSELFSQSEIPGFREIFASDSYLRKACWVVAFVFMTVLSLNDMTELITEYYEYPITVDVRLRDSSRLLFPSVTVCNLNVVRFSALCSSSATSDSSFDLASQIPSELRDKLCGIQVEKKKNPNNNNNNLNDDNNNNEGSKKKNNNNNANNNSSESDIGDINNIGITTPTTTTTTATISSTKTSDSNYTSPTSNNPPELGDDLQGSSPGQSNAGTTQFMGLISQRPAGFDAAAGDKTRLQSSTSASPAATTSVKRTTAKGSLDLGDFNDPASLLMMHDRRGGLDLAPLGSTSSPIRWAPRRSRSIRLTPTEVADQVRPFASSRGKVQVLPAQGESPQVDRRQRVKMNTMQQQQRANQFNYQQGVNVQPKAPQSQPQLPFGIRGPPNGNPNIRYGPPNNNHDNNNNNNNNNPNNAFTLPPQMTLPDPANGGQPPSADKAQFTTLPSFVPPALPDDFELTERQERELQENLTNWLAVMYNRDPKLTWSLGHQFDDMILRCTMKSINCTHQRSFENSFTPTEGNCFTYRSKVRRSTGGGGGGRKQAAGSGGAVYEEANLAGTNQGLELVLNLEKNEYISGSSQVGALVMIHHPSDLGYAASEATFVAPEFTTYIGLKMVNITRLPAPYPEYCVDSWPSKFADTLTRNSTYSQQACLKICLQKTIQSHCQCQSAFLPIVELDGSLHSTTVAKNSTTIPPGASTNLSTAELVSGRESALISGQISEQQQSPPMQRIIICDTRKLATRQCVREVMFRAADRVHNCECPPKCQVVRYDKTISMARWPTREDKVSFDRGKMDVNFQNLAKVIVYFQTMTCDEITQQAVFNAAKLFSALGGIMGMYVGFSFLSVFEIFEVMSRKMWHHFTLKLSNAGSMIVNKFGV